MIIDLAKIDESAWVPYEGDVELLVRPLSSSKQDEFDKAATADKIEFVGGRRVTVKKRDEEKYEELLRDWIVEDWKGFVDPEKNPIPCTKEVKIQILDHMHKLRRFALDAALDLHAIKQEQQDLNSSD